jgi:hypothetical protein
MQQLLRNSLQRVLLLAEQARQNEEQGFVLPKISLFHSTQNHFSATKLVF